MSEYKAQILSIILVLTLFSIMYTKLNNVFEDVWQQIENKITTQLNE